MARNSFLADTLKTFLFSLSQGLSASAGARGRQGTNLGMGAALGAPMQLREMERTRMLQEEERARLLEAAKAATKRGEIEDAVKMFNALKGMETQPMQVNAPVATPSPIGTLDGGTFQPPPLGGGQMGVPNTAQALPSVNFPGLGAVTPPNARDMAMQKANELRQQAQIEQEFAPPPPTPQPRNIDPLSQQGIAAQLALRPPQAPPAPRNIDPLSPEGIRAQLALRPPKEGPAPGQLSGIAQAALRDPSIIRGLTPTQRGEVYDELAKAGSLPQTQFAGVIDKGIETVELLKKMPGKSGAVGAKNASSLFGLKDRPLPGTPEADYRLKVDQLISLLTMPELEMMKGLGAMSDREFSTLSRAATALSTEGSEAGYDAELKRVEEVFANMKKRRENSAPLPTPPGGWSVKVKGQ